MTIRDNIIKQFNSGKLSFKDEKHIFSALNIYRSEQKAVRKILVDLEKEGVIIKDRFGRYATPEKAGAIVGTIDANPKGYAFLIPNGKKKGENDYFISHSSLKNALNRDVVLAVPKQGKDDEAVVIRILERGLTRIVGTLRTDKRSGYVIPDDAKYDSDIYVPLSLCGGAKNGDKVVCEITSYPQGRMPGGKVVEILGESGEFYTEELAIIRSFSLTEEFSQEVEKQAEFVSNQPIYAGERTDFRQLFTFTIDGKDTRDIDDAVSIERSDDGFTLYVHIADVSHYVVRSSKLDKEAYLRGTSVYFPDRVLPMLPRALSNGACSLNEGQDRYTLSCIMQFDMQGNRTSYKIVESVINSNRRMTYDDIDAILNGDATAVQKYPDMINSVAYMAELTKILKSKRVKAGCIELDIKEAHIYIDENDELVIPTYERLFSYGIIEQFMVSANEAVAHWLYSQEAPCLYRVHEKPTPEKITAFIEFASQLGINAIIDTENPNPASFGRTLELAEQTPYYPVINQVMLRSLMKARYCGENLGHFGLASECYCHFTSPIRRYPDLFVHRVIKQILHDNTQSAIKQFAPLVQDAAINTSECERRADSAERAVDDLYKTVYMSDRIGNEYDAIISGVTNFGIYAQLDNTIEGFIKIDTLPQDMYEFDERHYCLKGRSNLFKLGDRIHIKVESCDWVNMRPEFAFLYNKN